MATGTVQFEKTTFTPINGGVAYRTTFFTIDQDLGSASTTTFPGIDAMFAPMIEHETSPGTAVKVRGLEIYYDNTIGNTGDDGSANSKKIVNRLAKCTTDPTKTAADGYDVLLSAQAATDSTVAVADYTVTVKNLTSTPADIRVVLVCG